MKTEQSLNGTKFRELSTTDFNIEKNSPLGTGIFATVYKGTVRSIDSSLETQVAVKTISKSSHETALNGLLSEIKILAHLGIHDNIVGMVGAYTKGIRKGKICLFLELCSLGSLGAYLRENTSRVQYDQRTPSTNNRRTAKNQYDNVVVQIRERGLNQVCIEEASTNQNGKELNIHVDETRSVLSTKDLQKWAYEIANGMEFLASKNVVHADLATRNVLLTHDKKAKISDFGLSRRLYEYSMYVKTKQESMPWRWMAPESIRRLEFNEKSDVWSFGVTMWEIYSLGDVPFGGLSWSPNFCDHLGQGLRLQKPVASDHQTYQLMLKCWDMDSSKRPTFFEINSSFKNNYQL